MMIVYMQYFYSEKNGSRAMPNRPENDSRIGISEAIMILKIISHQTGK